MKKPTQQTLSYFDYSKCRDFLEEKYGYGGRLAAEQSLKGEAVVVERPHQDFLHFLIERTDINNGGLFTMDDEWLTPDMGLEDWQSTIVERYLDEFGTRDENGFRSITFLTSW